MKYLHLKVAMGLALILIFAKAWALPDIQHWQTDNGIPVYFVAASELPIIDIEIVFDAASSRDGEQAGIALMTNAMLAEGAGGLSAEQLSDAFADAGAEFANDSLRDMAWLSLRSLREDRYLQPALKHFLKILGQPDFPPAAFARERQRVLQSLAYDKQSPAKLLSKAFYRNLYGSHAYASPVYGTQNSLNALSSADLKAFYEKYYVASNAVIAMMGAVELKQAKALAQQISQVLSPGQKPPALAAASQIADAQTQHIDFPSTQTHIRLGQMGISRYAPDRFALSLANYTLGGGGLVSRLMHEVREKQGLAYSVYSRFSLMREAGPFVIGLQTRTDQTQHAITLVRQILQDYVKTGPSTAELQAAKDNMTGGFALMLDSNAKILSNLALIGFYGLPLDYLHTWQDKVRAVTLEQVREALKKHLNPEKMLLITVGKDSH
ncbi:M16 family metallopeptidase [Candidatus Venteria ishoeyi]|uniref:Peptidase M16 inactive domain protein n=1 Tax=Candidatus Venteria ishoeyi TaxID=1899563 RepID=A0A1H6FB13_9GAMM|nr:pitrilysin family protein [Candidatus Venteria ishoeyi]SEH06195.1 Peptidase M16 inactive domain protein [Candidatus Venteria ishoeyi]